MRRSLPFPAIGMIVIVATLAAAPVYGNVLIIDDDGGPGVDFTTLEAGFAAAQDGDTLLIKDGRYGYDDIMFRIIDIDGMNLTVIGERDANIDIFLYRFEIRNLNADERVVFRGITSGYYGFILEDNEGTVWLEDMGIYGLSGDRGAVDCKRCDNVVITHSSIDGPSGSIFTDAGAGIYGEDSMVTLYDTSVTGGLGEGASHGWDLYGGPGIVLGDGEAFLSGCTVVGGRGGGAPGGAGIILGRNASPVCRILDTTIRGGSGNPRGDATVNLGSGEFIYLEGVARTYWISSPDRFFGSTTIRFEGVPGESAWFPHALVTIGSYIPQWSGVLVTPFDLLVEIGTIPQSGVLELVLQTPEVAGFDQITFFGQGLFFSATEGLNLSSPSAAVLLDPVY